MLSLCFKSQQKGVLPCLPRSSTGIEGDCRFPGCSSVHLYAFTSSFPSEEAAKAQLEHCRPGLMTFEKDCSASSAPRLQFGQDEVSHAGGLSPAAYLPQQG